MTGEVQGFQGTFLFRYLPGGATLLMHSGWPSLFLL